jgi:hypothetical protein
MLIILIATLPRKVLLILAADLFANTITLIISLADVNDLCLLGCPWQVDCDKDSFTRHHSTSPTGSISIRPEARYGTLDFPGAGSDMCNQEKT